MHSIRHMERMAAEAAAGRRDPIEEIYQERRRQVDTLSYDANHDDNYNVGELALAAAAYAAYSAFLNQPSALLGDIALRLWPWRIFNFKPKDRRANLIKAGALILAEIERLDRAEAKCT